MAVVNKAAQLRWPVGEIITASFTKVPGKRRWNVVAIGVMPGQAVLISTPVGGGMAVPLYSGDQVTLRYLAGSDIVGFTSSVQRMVYEPFPYLLLHYPQEIETFQVRQAERAMWQDSPEVKCLLADAEEPVAARLLDISQGGYRVALQSEPPDLESEIELSFTVPVAGSEYDFVLPGTVRNVQVQRPGNPGNDEAALPTCTLGVAFDALAQEDKFALTALVYELLALERASG